jgi:hypothetical protein
MGLLEDMLSALDRIPGWKRLQQVPSEVDELKTKIAALEQLISGKAPPDYCRYCGARAARLRHSHLEKNVSVERWDCGECKNGDFRHRKV